MVNFSDRLFAKVAGVALLGAVLLASLPVRAQTLPDFPFVKSHGEASVQVAPDTATLQLTLRSEGLSSAQVVQDVETALAQSMALLQRHGITEKAIEATDMHKGSRREHPREPGALGPEVYYVYRSVKVRLESIDRYGEIFKGLAAIDHVSDLQGEFDVLDRAALEARLLQEAGKDAERRAVAMAASLGKKVKDVYAIMPDGDFLQGIGQERGYAAMMLKDSPIGSMVLVPETITVQQQVHAIFRLR